MICSLSQRYYEARTCKIRGDMQTVRFVVISNGLTCVSHANVVDLRVSIFPDKDSQSSPFHHSWMSYFVLFVLGQLEKWRWYSLELGNHLSNLCGILQHVSILGLCAFEAGGERVASQHLWQTLQSHEAIWLLKPLSAICSVEETKTGRSKQSYSTQFRDYTVPAVGVSIGGPFWGGKSNIRNREKKLQTSVKIVESGLNS